MWRASDPNNKRHEDKILQAAPETCPSRPVRRRRSSPASQLTSSSRHRIRRVPDQRLVIGSTDQLWPFSKIKVAVAVLNTAYSGPESDAIDVETPEGVAGPVARLRITERGSNHLIVEWDPPIEPNGIIRKYYVTCQVAPPNVGTPHELVIDDSKTLAQTILELESDTNYRIMVEAETHVEGRGSKVFVNGETLAASPPDKPLIGSIELGHDSALVTFVPSAELPATNPGTKFYVEYVEEENADKGPWSQTNEVTGRGGAVNVTDLEPGKRYTFRVVAVNGIGDTKRKMRSDSHTVQVGPDHAGAITYPPPVEHTTAAVPVAEELAEPVTRGSSDWFIILIVIIAILLLILIIVCIVMRSRGEMYPVQEKERLRGRDPLAPDDAPFGEYTAGGHPDLDRSRGSLDSDEKPLDSETDSLGEYEDPEATKFNEDGSFIGIYSGQKSRPPAVNTFV